MPSVKAFMWKSTFQFMCYQSKHGRYISSSLFSMYVWCVHTCIFAYMFAFVFVHACVCTCLFRPTVDTGNLPQLLIYFIFWGKVSQSHPGLPLKASLVRPLTCGSPWSPPSQGRNKLATSPSGILHGIWELNLRLLAGEAGILTAAPSP